MSKPSPIRLKVWGDYACFTRPEAKVERLSYDVITPSAARGILEAIYWKPQVRWVIERLHVLKPPVFTNLRRNEVASKASERNAKTAMKQAEKGETSKPLSIVVEDDRQQRAATILRDVAYVIEARFELLDDSEPVAKHYNMFKRRAENGQCFHRPYLGTREFACEFDWVEAPIPESQLVGEEDLGYMLHDMVYSKPEGRAFDLIDGHTGEKRCVEARFFKAKMKNGVIEVPPLPSPAEAE